MKQVVLSAAEWRTPRDAHEALAQALNFPAYYGHNLDALHDCLRDLDPTLLVIEHCAQCAEQLGPKWNGFISVFLDVQEENPRLEVRLVPGDGNYHS